MKRAYAILEIKSVNDEERVIEGIATTPKTDRLGDIVEPEGAEFKLPLPFLWHHNSREPVGHVEKAKVSKAGIAITARFLKIDEPGRLKDRLDEAWQSVKHKLVRGLSIGFAPIESSDIEGTWSQRFIRWDWLELSAVTIPANIDASIQTIKSADDLILRAALGDNARHGVVRLNSPPGASGKPASSIPKGTAMKSIAEQIAAFEAKRAATAARMSEIMDKSAEAGSTLDESQIQEYDGLAAELKAVDEHIVRLKAHEAKIVARAAAITLTVAADPAAASVARAGTGIFSVGARLEPGQKMARFALALKRARGNLNDALSICQNNRGWMDTSPEVAMVLKAAVAAGDTTTPGWASELVYAQNLANEFIEFLRPLTIIGKITNFRRVPFNVRMGSQTAGSTGYWVGQGLPVPVSKLTTSSQTLGMAKAAGLVSIDDELVRSSSPSAELMVRDDLAAAVTQLLDVSFIDPNLGAVVNVSPASVLQGVTPITPSGTDYAALKTDVKALFAPVIAANLGIEGGVFVMTHTTALALSLMQNALGQDQFPGININGGTWFGLPVITSQYALIPGSPQFGNIIALVFPREIFLADDGQITISISNEASIQMLDNPTNQSTGGTVATTMVSMFQTNSEAIKAVRYLNWAKRRPQAAQFIQAAAYS